ncbi:hypothetical protein A0H76_814 [Hepatospora eriocheir]|uniref:Uncharacterized protein n=1 Tax=Hepatospora eriocheir TaxID=1081669 RepID=A0A1X0QIG8_9MICR|nr:hypothetical protein A0H76_814 [Hepatospora eriocheir]
MKLELDNLVVENINNNLENVKDSSVVSRCKAVKGDIVLNFDYHNQLINLNKNNSISLKIQEGEVSQEEKQHFVMYGIVYDNRNILKISCGGLLCEVFNSLNTIEFKVGDYVYFIVKTN